MSKSVKSITDLTGNPITEEPFFEEKQLAHLAAVALGRRGGLKGGKARAEKLSAKRRTAIAKKAAEARWSKQKAQD